MRKETYIHDNRVDSTTKVNFRSIIDENFEAKIGSLGMIEPMNRTLYDSFQRSETL